MSMTPAELIAEGKRLRVSLVENEGPDDESTLYAFALWAVDTAEHLAAALEAAQAGASERDLTELQKLYGRVKWADFLSVLAKFIEPHTDQPTQGSGAAIPVLQGFDGDLDKARRQFVREWDRLRSGPAEGLGSAISYLLGEIETQLSRQGSGDRVLVPITDGEVEAVARELCRLNACNPDDEFEGLPMWATYKDEARCAVKTSRDYLPPIFMIARISAATEGSK
jgi:hypothetical protein